MPLISSTDIDNAISRVRNGVELVKLLHSLDYTNQDISASIKHYKSVPTQIGEYEDIVLSNVIGYLKQLNQQ